MKTLYKFVVAAKTLIALRLTSAFAFGANSAAKEAFDRGVATYEQGNLQEAIKQYTQAIKIDPNSAQAYNNRGIAYGKLGDYGKAIADFTQAIKIDPKYATAYNNRAVAYAFLNDLKNATKDARKACELGECTALQILAQEKLLRD
ncbi:MAG: tetratricopeptide repeat protein [Helicobacteraceae bacterium]|jgi:tetratricopeptide (TPR) repeat protein|nr:tetratricopeptide repeat protein [Helicobacteraceae bacterium]